MVSWAGLHTLDWLVMPVLIFLARICDVTIGTVRIMLLSRGLRFLVAAMAFVEVLIWLFAIRQIMNNISEVSTYIAFAGGFATGNYVGMLLEEKLAMGVEVIRIITRKSAGDLITGLKEAGYGVTVLDAQGSTGVVNVIFTMVSRKEHRRVVELINRFNPNAFYSTEDVRTVSKGVFPENPGMLYRMFNNRKGK